MKLKPTYHPVRIGSDAEPVASIQCPLCPMTVRTFKLDRHALRNSVRSHFRYHHDGVPTPRGLFDPPESETLPRDTELKLVHVLTVTSPRQSFIQRYPVPKMVRVPARWRFRKNANGVHVHVCSDGRMIAYRPGRCGAGEGWELEL